RGRDRRVPALSRKRLSAPAGTMRGGPLVLRVVHVQVDQCLVPVGDRLGLRDGQLAGRPVHGVAVLLEPQVVLLGELDRVEPGESHGSPPPPAGRRLSAAVRPASARRRTPTGPCSRSPVPGPGGARTPAPPDRSAPPATR